MGTLYTDIVLKEGQAPRPVSPELRSPKGPPRTRAWINDGHAANTRRALVPKMEVRMR